MSDRQMTQWAPYPQDLEDAVEEFRYKPDWRFWLSTEGRDYAPEDHDRLHPIAGGLTLNFHVPCLNSYHPERPYPGVHHTHIVPAATYNRQAWEEWILSCVLLSENHETCEWARFVLPNVEAERRPFAPTHGPGDNPYVVRFPATDFQRRMSFRGIENSQ